MSQGTTTTQRMTAEEFYDWVHRPENTNRWFELVRGEVIELPPPTRPHGVFCIRVGSLLDRYADQQGKFYVASNDSGVILERDPDTVRGPDVALYDDATTFADLHPKYGEVPPRLAVEVLSPDDRANRVMRKIADYLRTGVAMVWVLDPETRTITIHRPDRPQCLLGEGEELSGDDVLPEFRCPVSDFFHLPGERKQVPPT
jgi:Uma2 family endonuclease